MPESSVKITLGIELDKSEIGQQIQEMQKELDSYRLKIGVDREQLTASSQETGSTGSNVPKSFESAGSEENIDFGSLSDLANEKFGETYGLIDVVNDTLVEILDEVKGIYGVLKGITPTEATGGDSAQKPGNNDTNINSAIKEAEDAVSGHLTDIVNLVTTISSQLDGLSNNSSVDSPVVAQGDTVNSRPTQRLDATGDVSSSTSDIISIVQDGINQVVTEFNQLIESIGDPVSSIQKVIDIITSSAGELVSITKDALDSITTDIVKIISDLLEESLTEIQNSVLNLLEKSLQNLIASILDSISGKASGKGKDGGGGDNTASSISSGITSLISVMSRLQEVLYEQLSSITGNLLPAIITQLQFDFFKSLISGAVERLGAVLINQSAGGAAKLTEGVITGNVFGSKDPAGAATLAFGQGFADSDPTLVANSLKGISTLLETTLIDGNGNDDGLNQLSAQVEQITDQLIRVIKGQSNCSCESDFNNIVAVLMEIAAKIDFSNQLLSEIKDSLSISSASQGDSPRTLPYGEEINANAPPLLEKNTQNLGLNQEPTNVDFQDISQLLLPAAEKPGSELDVSKLYNNLAKIVEDVFSPVGLSLQKIIEAGSFPQINIDKESKLGGQSKYDRATNQLLVGQETARRLASSGDIGQKEFIEIAKELRKAIQSEFGASGFAQKAQKAGRGENLSVGGVAVPILKQKDLLDKQKLSSVKDSISAANLRDVDPSARPGIQKGVKALNTDAEVFAQNLADTIYNVQPPSGEQSSNSTQNNIPGADNLLRATDNKSMEALAKPLEQLVQGNADLIVLNRENVQKDRSNINRLTGDSYLKEPTGVGKAPEKQVTEVMNKAARLFDIFGTQFKNFAVSSAQKGGISPDLIKTILGVVENLNLLKTVLSAVSPSISNALDGLGVSLAKDVIGLSINGAKEVVDATSSFAQGANESGSSEDNIPSFEEIFAKLATRLEEITGISIPKEKIKESAKKVGVTTKNYAIAAGQTAVDMLPPTLVSNLVKVLEKINILGGSLLRAIGQLISNVKTVFTTGESPASATALIDIINSTMGDVIGSRQSSDTLNRKSNNLPDMWEIGKNSPDYPLDSSGKIPGFSIENNKRSLMGPANDIPDPWTTPPLSNASNIAKEAPIQAQLVDEKLFTPPDFSSLGVPLGIRGESSPTSDSRDKKIPEDNASKTPVKGGEFDIVSFLKKALPVAIAGLVVSKLGVSFLNKIVPGKAGIERTTSVNDLQSTLTKALITAVTIAIGQKLLPQVSAALSPDKGLKLSDRVSSIFNKQNSSTASEFPDTLEQMILARPVGAAIANGSTEQTSNLPKLIAVAIAGVLTTSLAKTFISAQATGEPRQKSLGEKLIGGAAGILGTIATRGTRNVKEVADRSPLNITKNDSLISKTISTVLSNSIAGTANKLLGGKLFGSTSGNKQEKAPGSLATGGVLEGLLSRLPLLLTSLIIAGLLSQVVPQLLSNKIQTSDGQEKTAQVGPAKSSQEKQSISSQVTSKSTEIPAEIIDYAKISENASMIAEKVLASAGIDTKALKEQGLMPKIGVDEKNKYKGASVYSGKSNQILIGQDHAKGLADASNVSKDSFITLIHELRHAMQTNFGQTGLGSVVSSLKGGNTKLTAQEGQIDLIKIGDLLDQSKSVDVDKQAILSTQGVSNDWYNSIKALEVDAETFAQNLATLIYGKKDELPIGELKRNNKVPTGTDLAKSINSGKKSITELEKTLDDLIKVSKIAPQQQSVANLANSIKIDIPDVVLAETPNLLNTPVGLPLTDMQALPDPTLDLSMSTSTSDQQDNKAQSVEPDTGNKWQSALLAIKVGVEKIMVLLDRIAMALGKKISPTLNLGKKSLSTLDALYRQVPVDKKKNKKDSREEEKTRAVKIGESIGEKFVSGIENVQEKLNTKMQDAGMNEDRIRGLTDQAGAYIFSNLSAFFPAGAIGVALAPVVASLSALGLPIAAAVNQLAPIGQMLADTMRTLNPIQTRFETIGGSPEKGTDLMNFAEKVAMQYNTPLLASLEGYSRLTAASKGSKLEGQDTEQLFVGVSQAMAALGLNAQDASLIFLAFQQVISKGKVAAEELRGQIGERLPGAIQLAAKSMGMSVVDFGKALDNGEISANVLLPKLGKALQEEYGAGAEAASKGFLGTLNKIENSLFNFRRIMVTEFGGIVAGVARVAASSLDLIIKFIDNILLKSGLMFNAFLGIQAQIIAGTAFLFTKLDLPLALAKALSGGYGKLSLVLIPFVFGLFQEILGTVFAKLFGIEIAGAIEMISGFFSNVVGRVIQTVIDLSDDPKQVMEGMINLVRSIGLGFMTATNAVLEMGIAVRDKFGIATDSLTWFIQKLGTAEKLINRIADNSISKIYAPQVDSSKAAPSNSQDGTGADIKSIFNVKAIARASLEFFGLFVIMIQTFVLMRILGEQVLKMGGAFKTFAAEFGKAFASMKTGKSILSMLTLGFSGLNLVLAGLFTLIALMVFKSDTVNTFLSELSNSVKDLEKLNANLDNLTNRKIDITTRITQLDQETGLRDTPFQDKGLTLSFWRDKNQEQITSDDIIRKIQKQIDSTAYRRDLPLLPNNFSESRGSLFDKGNMIGLGNILTSEVGQQNQPQSFEELLTLREKLAKERDAIENDLTFNLQLDSTNIFDELTKLKTELSGVDEQLSSIQKKRDGLGERNNLGQVFSGITDSMSGKGTSPGVNATLVETVKAFRDGLKYIPGLGKGASGTLATPELAVNLLIGAEFVDNIEKSIPLMQRKSELESQIRAYEQQSSLAPGGTQVIGLNPMEDQIKRLELALNETEKRIRNTSSTRIPVLSPTPGFGSLNDFDRLNQLQALISQKAEIEKSLQFFKESVNFSTEAFDKEIKKRKLLIDQLETPRPIGRTTKEENKNRVSELQREITALSVQRQAALAIPAREELSRINQDIRAIEVFTNTPGVFNNAFNQDDTILREMASQQLDFFSMIQDSRINPQRLNEGNLVSTLPSLQDDVRSERDFVQNQIQQLQQELSKLDLSSANAQEKVKELNKELKSLNNRLVGLKGLNRFLDITQSYANLGAGKQEIQSTRIERSLNRLAEQLKTNGVQSTALQQFQSTPTLPNLALLEQDILLQLVPAQQAVARAVAEKQNVQSTPMLRTEKDLRSAGYVTKEQKGRLDAFRALDEKIQRDIQTVRKQVSDAYAIYSQATSEGLDFRPALENYYAVGDQLKELKTQLQDLRAERDKFLDEIKTVAPPIQVDDTARQQRLTEVDQAIREAEYRVNELAKQYELIQETKSGLGGLGQIGEDLDVAAAKLREPLKGFAAVWEFVTRNPRKRTARAFETRSDILNPALETVGGFIDQQQNLSPAARGALIGGLNSGDYAQTRQVLESIDIKDGKIYFGGEELDGTTTEIKSFVEALKTATKILDFISNRSKDGSKPVKQAIEDAFGLQTVDTQRAEIANQYYGQIASLATSGVFSESQLMNLTQDGLKFNDAQKILDEVKNRDGLTNFQSVIESLKDRGASPGEINSVLQNLQALENTFVDALALDPRGATKVKLGTIGEEEYTQTIGKLDQISRLAFESAQKLGVQFYDGNIDNFEAAIQDIKPAFIDNITQLRSLEEQLSQTGQQRILVEQELQRIDLTKAERTKLTGIATALDDEFKKKYREKKVAGTELSESLTFYKNADEQLSLLAEKIKGSDFSQAIKDSTLGQIEETRAKYITPGLDLLTQYEDLMILSGEEALEAAGKAITKAMENFEKIARIIDAETSKKLSDITKAMQVFSSNTELAITDFNKSVAGLAGDPEKIAAEKNLATANINKEQSGEKLQAAQKAKEDVDKNVEITLQKAAFSPIESLAAVSLAREKQAEAQNILSQALEEYTNNATSQVDAQLSLIAVESQVPVRISQFNSKQRGNQFKQQRLDGILKDTDLSQLQLQDEIGLLDIEIASTAVQLEKISQGIKDGYITNVTKANEKIQELMNSQQDLMSNRLDKLLEQENQERERSIKLLENQSSLSSKYFNVAINGYELLNKETERYSKQLDNLTRVGEQLKTLSQSQFQVKIGRSENQLSIADAAVATRERLSSQDLSPRERSFQQRRLGALASLGQSYGVQPAAFGANEDAALAEQQKIATKLAKDKLEAMKKEQAIAAKLLDIELQRNQIAAEMAVREAEIGKLRAEQAVTEAQFGLQQALLGTDQTAIKLAELELQIAKSQQGLSDAELGSAKENLALQSLFSQLQKEAFNLDSASARDGLITEVAGNQNVDIASILQSLKNFKNFDPNKANPREVFKPYLDWIESQTPKRDPNTPIGLPLEAFNGDIQAWIEANVAIAKQDEANKKSSAPAEIQSLESLFTRVFGAPVASKIDISNGPVKDIGEEIARLNAGRLGEKIAPTQEMIDSVSGQRDINNALEQARRLAQSTEPIDNSRMASDIYAMSTSMADSAASLLTIQELLGRITNGTATGVSVAVPDLGQGGQALDDVNKLIDSQQNNLRGILNDIVLPQAEDLSNGNGSKAVPASQGTIGTERFPVGNKPYTLDLKDSILPPPVPYNPTTTTPSSPQQKVSSLFEPIIKTQSILPPAEANTQSNMGGLAMTRPILNPTIQNSVTPRYSPPAVNVDMQNKQPDYFYQRLAQTPNIDIASAQREPGYFYRNLASEVSPQVAYRVPPGIQATQGATSFRPASNTTINITNKIDAASQREMYAKIGETQTKSILSALNQLA